MFFNNNKNFSSEHRIAFLIFFIILMVALFISFFIVGLWEETKNPVSNKCENPVEIKIFKIETEMSKNEYQSLGIREISAYTLSEDETDNDFCMTASGVNACESELPIIATNFLPFWTYVEIKGKEYVVLDRMNSRYQNGEMDILMRSRKEAFEFGRQRLEVKIIK